MPGRTWLALTATSPSEHARMGNEKDTRLRFSLSSILLLVAFAALVLVTAMQFDRIQSLQAAVTRLESASKQPEGTIAAASFTEIVTLKSHKSTFVTKALLSADGRKRVEHLSARSPLVTIYDSWGVDRLSLSPMSQRAKVLAVSEPWNGGPQNLKDWITRFESVKENADSVQSGYDFDGRALKRYEKSAPDGGKIVVWCAGPNEVLRRIDIDSQSEKRSIRNIMLHETVDPSLFDHQAPEWYKTTVREEEQGP